MPESTLPIVSVWLVAPVCALIMLVIVGHTLALQCVPLSPSTRRIRTAGGVLMLLLMGVLAIGLSVVAPADRREFVLVWVLILALAAMVMMIAALDVVNTLRLYAGSRKRLNQQAAERLATEAVARLIAAKPAAVHAVRRHTARDDARSRR